MSHFWMVLGFGLAAYAITANDAIQTLGTFLSSNRQRSWLWLWLYVSGIEWLVLLFSWLMYQGDVSYGRLGSIALPKPLGWFYILPPLLILVLTQFRLPVSTTFLILTVFSPQAFSGMLIKSLAGYVIAFMVGFLLYRLLLPRIERHFGETTAETPAGYWIGAQWLTTAFLWSQWLIQDFANIFAYLPRQLNWRWLVFALILLGLLQGILMVQRGGGIQEIVTSKTNTQDIRAASIIDLIYGLILLGFKEYSAIPMSTTWVFIGLLGGRELALVSALEKVTFPLAGQAIAADGLKALLGLGFSLLLALGLPLIATFDG